MLTLRLWIFFASLLQMEHVQDIPRSIKQLETQASRTKKGLFQSEDFRLQDGEAPSMLILGFQLLDLLHPFQGFNSYLSSWVAQTLGFENSFLLVKSIDMYHFALIKPHDVYPPCLKPNHGLNPLDPLISLGKCWSLQLTSAQNLTAGWVCYGIQRSVARSKRFPSWTQNKL